MNFHLYHLSYDDTGTRLDVSNTRRIESFPKARGMAKHHSLVQKVAVLKITGMGWEVVEFWRAGRLVGSSEIVV